MPLLFIDVNITPTETQRISIFEGDTPRKVAASFCTKYNLSSKMEGKLIALLELQMQDIDELIKQQQLD